DQLHSMQGQLNVLAGQIDQATGAYEETQQLKMDTQNRLDRAQSRFDSIRGELDQRAAFTYMEGPGTGLELILGSTSLSDFTDRLQYLDSVQQHDSDLAIEVQHLADQLHIRQEALAKVLAKE